MTGAHSAEELGRASLARLGLVVALTMLGFVFWFWSTRTFLCSLVRPNLRPKTGFFRAAIIYPVVYAFAVPSFFMSAKPWLFYAIMMPMLLFAMICLTYNVYFVAKSLALALTGEPKSLADSAGTFLLLWFFPVGVWKIQPQINRLYSARRTRHPREVTEGMACDFAEDDLYRSRKRTWLGLLACQSPHSARTARRLALLGNPTGSFGYAYETSSCD